MIIRGKTDFTLSLIKQHWLMRTNANAFFQLPETALAGMQASF
jgi:hypothetical protein